MDVEGPVSGWKASQQRPPRTRGRSDKTYDGFRGCDPRFRDSRLPDQEGCCARPLHDTLVYGDEDGNVSPVLRSVLRNLALGHGRLGHRHGTGTVCAMAERRWWLRRRGKIVGRGRSGTVEAVVEQPLPSARAKYVNG